MRLDKIEMKNYRSIKSEDFAFNHNLQILVGLNESGKSNILKAISLLNEKQQSGIDDIRDTGHEENHIEHGDSTIMYEFKLEDKEVKQIYSNVVKEYFRANDYTLPIIDYDKKSYTLEELCGGYNSFPCTREVANNKINYQYYIQRHIEHGKVNKSWKKVIDKDLIESLELKTKTPISNDCYINISDYPDIPSNAYEEIDTKKLMADIGSELIKLGKKSLPSVLFWKYSESNLLPGEINFDSFNEDSYYCEPLRNMFLLAGYSNVEKAITDAQPKKNGIINLFNNVADAVTTHMKKVWSEWKDQKVELRQDGNIIRAGIFDIYNTYNLDQRSDGFKRFFTFLLMLSAKNESEVLKNHIILIDEPDLGLHPSGIGYLRNELKNISKDNLIVVSTHSIFMIDKEEIGRHILVKKEKEITSYKHVETSNITEEEVIYNALNYSLFEMLKPINIIFEGWRDKSLFERYLKSTKGRKYKKKLSNIGFLHANGVKDIDRIATLCENFNRKYLIISDADKPALEKKKLFDGQGAWFTFLEIDGVDAITPEDFVSTKKINKELKIVSRKYNINPSLTVSTDTISDKLASISHEFKGKDEKRTFFNDLKSAISESVKPADLDSSYEVHFNFIVTKAIELQ